MSAQPSVDVVAMGLVLADLERRERQISALRKKCTTGSTASPTRSRPRTSGSFPSNVVSCIAGSTRCAPSSG
jgi:hypothetical protein